MTTNISWWRTGVGEPEIERMAAAIRSENLSQGPVVAELEKKLSETLSVPYVMMTPSGSASLLMAMLVAGVGPGDEIIVPAYTWIATAHAGRLLGAKIVLADIEPDRPILDIHDVERHLTPRTKVVVPVHLNGRAADMSALMKLAEKHNFMIVEDACQGLFSKSNGKYLGTIGDLGCFSLGVTKLITTGQGGFVVTSSAALYEKMRAIKTHGVTTDARGLETYVFPGFNFKFTDFQAAMGIEQISHAVDRIDHVKKIDRRYAAAFPNIPYLRHVTVDVEGGEVPLWVEIETAERERLIDFLKAHGIQANRVHLSLDHAPHLGKQDACSNARSFAKRGLILPCGPTQPLENVDQVIDVLRRFNPETV